jgi:hypothetical protein
VGSIGSRFRLWLGCIVVAAGAVAQEPAREPVIQYVEPVDLAVAGGAAHFEAYGRRFDLTLADDDRVLAKLGAARKAELRDYRLLRGAVDGRPGSWVRLVRSAAGTEGAIWDGEELYAVTRYDRVAAALNAPLDVAPDQTVTYRLSDLRDGLPREICGLESAVAGKQSNGLDDYRAMVAELRAGVTPEIGRQIEISMIGDTEFQQAEADPTAALLARLNIVEGIYSEQVGVLVLATDLRLMPLDADPLRSTSGGVLLEQLSAFRQATQAVRARGLAHLVTGKDLDGTTAGIAYVGTVCDAKLGVSLSQHSFGTTISALIMAHELGHNFGAAHDGVANTACADVSGGYIMAPSVSGLASFSQCSVATMRAVIDGAACVTAAEYADVTFEPTTAIAGEAGVPFVLPYVVHAAGNVDVENVTATITLPAPGGYSIEGFSLSQGSCAISGLTATCSLGTVMAGTRATVSVTGRGTGPATFAASARLSATNDQVSSNDVAATAVAIRSGVDAALAIGASAASVPVTGTVDFFVDVTSRRAMAVRGAILSVTLSQPVAGATMPGATCSANPYSVSCTIAEIGAGATRRLTVQVKAAAPGPIYASGNVNVTGDGDFANNAANASSWAQAPRDIQLTSGPATVDLGVGVVHEIPYLVRSRGPVATGDVTFVLSVPSGALVVEGVDGGGIACEADDLVTWECDVGALAPGASRELRVRVRGTRPVTAEVRASAVVADDGYGANNDVTVQLRIDHLVDVAVTMASGGTGVEDAPLEGQATLRSSGRLSATGGLLEIQLHAAGTLRAAKIHNGADCALLPPSRARCTLPDLARNAQIYVDYTAVFDEPGNYDVTFAATTPGDTAAANDTLTRAVLVRPHYDVAIAGDVELPAFLVGQTREKTFTVTSDRRGLATARFVAPQFLPGLRVESIRASSGVCGVDDDAGFCDFTDLPPHASETVTVTYRAAEGSYRYDALARVSTPGDVSAANDIARGRADVQAPTDLELRSAAGSVSGTSGATFDLPAITVHNHGVAAFGVRVDVTLPTGVTLVGISASSAICAGTGVVRCDFDALEAGATTTLVVSVRADSAGSFRGTIRVSASNDTNAVNDTREFAIEVAAVTSTSTASPAKAKGGGGAMEWLGLALLALVSCARSARRARFIALP